MMKVGDLVLHKSGNGVEGSPGIVVKVYDYHFEHLQEEGSKRREMAAVHWFHIKRSEPMQHRQDRLEVISENR